MSLCESIDSLAMAYLDGELATEERHELEAHLCECADCRVHVDTERSEHDLLRKALAAPPAPDLLRAKLVRALDAEDKAQRRRWTQYILPGSAMCAAAAAIAVFVGMNPNVAPEVSGWSVIRESPARLMSCTFQATPSPPRAGSWTFRRGCVRRSAGGRACRPERYC